MVVYLSLFFVTVVVALLVGVVIYKKVGPVFWSAQLRQGRVGTCLVDITLNKLLLFPSRCEVSLQFHDGLNDSANVRHENVKT